MYIYIYIYIYKAVYRDNKDRLYVKKVLKHNVGCYTCICYPFLVMVSLCLLHVSVCACSVIVSDAGIIYMYRILLEVQHLQHSSLWSQKCGW